jgi:hypothetical protein
VRASKEFHGYRRLGDSKGGVFVASGVDSIDATAVNTYRSHGPQLLRLKPL